MTKEEEKKYVLIIDGNYFLMRGWGVTQATFTTDIIGDTNRVLVNLSQRMNMINEMFGRFVDNIIFVRDGKSWRKDVRVVKPIEMPDTEDGKTYKSSRAEKNLDVDWEQCHMVFDRFCDMLTSELRMPVVKPDGAEGDDTMYAVSQMLANTGKRAILWATDGDLEHLVDDNVLYYRTTKDAKLLMSGASHEKITKVSEGMDAILNSCLPDNLDAMCNVFTPDTAKVYLTLLTAIVSGKKKDDVPPLFQWVNAKKTMKYKPSDSHIKKTLKAIEGNALYTGTVADFYNDEFIELFIAECLKVCKLTRDIEHTKKVWESNRKLSYLNKKEIPLFVLQNIVKEVKEHVTKRVHFDKMEQQVMENALNLEAETSDFFDKFGIK